MSGAGNESRKSREKDDSIPIGVVPSTFDSKLGLALSMAQIQGSGQERRESPSNKDDGSGLLFSIFLGYTLPLVVA